MQILALMPRNNLLSHFRVLSGFNLLEFTRTGPFRFHRQQKNPYFLVTFNLQEVIKVIKGNYHIRLEDLLIVTLEFMTRAIFHET